MAKKPDPTKPAGPKRVDNRRARYDYNILDSVEAGLVLVGSEVKSLFHGKANLTDAYCLVREGEMWLISFDIEPYEKASVFQHERRRDRKLLLHKAQIETFARKSQEKGLALIPLAVYFKNGRAKVEIGLGRGKAEYDKRDQIAAKESRREMDRIRAGKL
ncbi:MAG: SsrA-binding protein SmpB [Fimbriimonas sp.]